MERSDGTVSMDAVPVPFPEMRLKKHFELRSSSGGARTPENGDTRGGVAEARGAAQGGDRGCLQTRLPTGQEYSVQPVRAAYVVLRELWSNTINTFFKTYGIEQKQSLVACSVYNHSLNVVQSRKCFVS